MTIKLSPSKQPLSNDLLKEAERRGLLDSSSTKKCQNCPAIYPKEYDKCPRCEILGPIEKTSEKKIEVKIK